MKTIEFAGLCDLREEITLNIGKPKGIPTVVADSPEGVGLVIIGFVISRFLLTTNLFAPSVYSSLFLSSSLRFTSLNHRLN